MTNESGSQTVDVELDAMRACATAIEMLDQEARHRLLGWLAARYGDHLPLVEQRALPAKSPASWHMNSSRADEHQPQVTVKRFVQDKAPQTDVERITVLAYYLAHYRGKLYFKTADLSELNTEAAQPKFSNAADAASNALKASGYLADAGKGMRQLSAKGEDAVEALPDRDALKAVQNKYASSRRRRPVKTATGGAED